MTTIERPAGFTLVELLVSLALVSILAGAVTPLVANVVDFKRGEAVIEDLNAISAALEDYYFGNAGFPAALDDPSFLGPFLLGGVNGRRIEDDFGAGALFRYSATVSPDRVTVYSLGENGTDDGDGVEEYRITVHGSVPGNRHTRMRIRIIVESLAAFLESGGTVGASWVSDLGLGAEYERDGFGTLFVLGADLVLRSAGADRVLGTADDLTS